MHRFDLKKKNLPPRTSLKRLRPAVLIMLFGAKMEDHNSLKNIPTSERTIAERCRKVAGFAPYYCLDVLHSNARASYVWAFLLRLNEGSDEVPVGLKQVRFCWRDEACTIAAAPVFDNGMFF